MKKFTVITLSAMFCGLVVLSACGGGAASGSAASSDAPLAVCLRYLQRWLPRKKHWTKACVRRMIWTGIRRN